VVDIPGERRRKEKEYITHLEELLPRDKDRRDRGGIIDLSEDEIQRPGRPSARPSPGKGPARLAPPPSLYDQPFEEPIGFEIQGLDLDRPPRSSTARPGPGPSAARAPSGSAPFVVRPAGEVRPAKALSIARQPNSIHAQQYRLLKYKLKEGLDPRLIGVTSPEAGEGKTTVVANLGLALAEGRRVRVLLLDLNLKSPALSNLFGISSALGIEEQLRRKRRDPGASWEVLELGSRLHLIGGASPTENTAPLLSSEEVGILLSDIAQHYDYAVVDLPAVLAAADAKIVQELLDGLVLVLRSASSKRASTRMAIEQLGRQKLHGVLMLEVEGRYIPR
jgi:Mrp family chromosome partitioning ATPase